MTRVPVESSEEREAGAKPREKPRGAILIDTQRCKGCAYCVEFCPLGVLAMCAGFNTHGYHYPEIIDEEKCTGCDLCGLYCPDFAICGVRVSGPSSAKE